MRPSSVAYVAGKGVNWLVVEDGQPGAQYEGIVTNGLAFRPDGILEYLAIRDNSLYRVKHIPVQ